MTEDRAAQQRTPTPKNVTNSYEDEYKRAENAMRPALFEKLKAYPIPLTEFDDLVKMVCGVIAQHYREGAYHGDISARGQ